MSQPPVYDPLVNFQQEETNQVAGRSTVRTAALDNELALIEAFSQVVVTNLAYIQRDDKELRNLIVKLHTLAQDVLVLIGSGAFTVHSPVEWATAIAYPARDMVKSGTGTYVSVVAHTSGVFATDLAAGKWLQIWDAVAAIAGNVTFTPAGTIVATNVQAAIEEAASEALQKASNLSDVASAATSRSNLAVPSKGEIQSQAFVYWTDTGTADALAITPTPALTAYASGQRFTVKKIASPSATATPTLNVNALGAKTIFKAGGLALQVADLVANGHYEFEYDAAYDGAVGGWELLNPNNPAPLTGDLTINKANPKVRLDATGTTQSIIELLRATLKWALLNEGDVADDLVLKRGATEAVRIAQATGNVKLAAALLFGAAVSKLIAGATSFAIRNNADTADNLVITDAGGIDSGQIGADATWKGSSIAQNIQNAAYTLVASDANKHIEHTEVTARTWTIPANASVAYKPGTAVTFHNGNGAGVITIAITTDTMRLSPGGTVGSRTLAANGLATALKVAATEWVISGTGLT